MYDELVKALRVCADGEHCIKCPKWELKLNAGRNACEYAICTEAADAIEELSMKLHGDEAAIAGMKREIERMVVADKPRWIPVTERLPEDLTRVIVFCEDGVSFGLCEHLIADDEEVVEWHDTMYYPVSPTHWMPLPEPPTEE